MGNYRGITVGDLCSVEAATSNRFLQELRMSCVQWTRSDGLTAIQRDVRSFDEPENYWKNRLYLGPNAVSPVLSGVSSRTGLLFF
ncbi:unnamed protein product [Phyllotreta striolata]|uniref:Uncharacterized protein n=1 Tax=Phyllotreta striolata TaxID=444603 RepID=A0A9N9TJF3_PHYSR|nr:unnamed protein product [Phyllotreta striolata]